MSDGERAARILALSAVVGLLIPGPEQSDSTERLNGSAGVNACLAALQSESNSVRRVELTLAKAIHQLESDNNEAAVADAQAALRLAEPLLADPYFARSLGLSVLEVNAATLVKAGRFSEAEAVAYRLADAAPYDVINQLRAWKYLGITTERDAEFERFLNRLSRLWNGSIEKRANQLEWQGKFAEANAVYAALLSVYQKQQPHREHNDVSGFWKARQAITLMLAGKRAESEALIGNARALNERLAHGALGSATGVGLTDELIEFHNVLSLLADGKKAEARQRFLLRSRWNAPTTGSLARTVDSLREGATPAELIGSLARNGTAIRQDIVDRARIIPPSDKLSSQLFRSFRPVIRLGEFRTAARSVWKAAKSPYLVERKGEFAVIPQDIIIAHDISGYPSSYAVLMHAALVARQRGKQGFVLVGDRKSTDTIGVFFGNAGDVGTPGELLLETGAVIEAMRADFPEPRRSN